MNITGIITEYNPFHNGHLYHLTEAKKNKALEQIKNLENKYYNYLRMYGYAKGANEQIQIQEELERILESINHIAIKEKLPNKRINNTRAKARMDIARLYGH